MRLEVYTLNFPTVATAGEGTALRCADLQSKYVQIAGLTGTANVEGTIDGTNWVVLAAAANGLTSLPASVLLVRMKRATDGAGTATLAGLGRAAE